MAPQQMIPPGSWRNRIVGHGEEPLEAILFNPSNWRVHPKAQQEALEGILNQVGWVQDVIVNRTTGHLVDGHLRCQLAARKGETTIPVVYVELTAEEEALVLATIDPVAALATTDRQKLDDLLCSVQSDDARVQRMLSELAEREGLAYGKVEGQDEPPAIEVDRFEEVAAKWGTADGQLWQLGAHRILCADSLNPDNIALLMRGETPALIIADPPYGINIVTPSGFVGGGEAYDIPFGGRKKGYVGGENAIKDRTGHYPIENWRKNTALTGSDGASKPFGSKERRGSDGAVRVVAVGKYPVIIGDEDTKTAERAVRLYRETYPDAVQVWWGANYYSPVLPASMCWLVWFKETTGNFADCELAWTNQNRAARLFQHRWNGMLRDSEHERRWHPTQKPAALAAWVYEQFTEDGAIILDPFAGAGWTLLGGEQSGRSVRAIEQSHEYIAVILERWASLTGQTPALLDGLP